jgi:fructose-1,6-bisphosphatase
LTQHSTHKKHKDDPMPGPTSLIPVPGQTTLEEALAMHLSDVPAELSTALQETLLVLTTACADVSETAAMGALGGAHGSLGVTNCQGEVQQKLDMLADGRIGRALAECRHVAAWASEEHEQAQVPHPRENQHGTQGRLLVVYDPLDGSSNIEANISIGTIFSILPHPYRGTTPGDAGFMQPGHQQLAAGYVSTARPPSWCSRCAVG